MKTPAFLLLLAMFAGAAGAQTLAEGARVRLTLLEPPQKRVVGSLLAIRPDAVEIRPDSLSRTIARANIDRLEISRGIKSGSGKGAKYGAIFGGVILGSLGIFAAAVANSESSEHVSPVAAGAAYGLAGAVVGGGLGALIASGSHYEKWEQVPLE
jgi:hypothetical protein